MTTDSRYHSLYMDDLQISYRHSDWKVVQRKLQESINIVEKFAQKNGFQFSTSKTSMLHFTVSDFWILMLPSRSYIGGGIDSLVKCSIDVLLVENLKPFFWANFSTIFMLSWSFLSSRLPCRSGRIIVDFSAFATESKGVDILRGLQKQQVLTRSTILGTSYTGDKVINLWVPIINMFGKKRNHDISDRNFDQFCAYVEDFCTINPVCFEWILPNKIDFYELKSDFLQSLKLFSLKKRLRVNKTYQSLVLIELNFC